MQPGWMTELEILFQREHRSSPPYPTASQIHLSHSLCQRGIYTISIQLLPVLVDNLTHPLFAVSVIGWVESSNRLT